MKNKKHKSRRFVILSTFLLLGIGISVSIFIQFLVNKNNVRNVLGLSYNGSSYVIKPTPISHNNSNGPQIISIHGTVSCLGNQYKIVVSWVGQKSVQARKILLMQDYLALYQSNLNWWTSGTWEFTLDRSKIQEIGGIINKKMVVYIIGFNPKYVSSDKEFYFPSCETNF